ncbi:uncharacterized protein VP01_2313g5 [Puccinia sorghi]|uniref:Uncharacterized protein n=1 Tax=Puccinia sorghi TaxID=27349 RepID=A0A0L6V9K5_9BASI|nr:uncharacterized protein VP01_2313g5 [Puccinia sorghi]
MTLDETSQQNAGDDNPQVECDLNVNNESDKIREGCNNTNASSNTTWESSHLFSPWLSQSESTRSRITLGQSSTSQVDPHMRAGLRAEMQSPMKRTGQSGQAASGLEEHLTAFFDPMARDKRDAKNSMTNFYAMQLRDANKLIETLCNEVTRLRTSNQSKVTTLQEKVTELKIQNQTLKSKVDLLQMRIEIYSSRMMFASQHRSALPVLVWLHTRLVWMKE